MKPRDDVPDPPEQVAITSEKDEDGRLLWAKVTSEGPVESKASAAEALVERLREELAEHGPMKAVDLAKAVDLERTSTTFDRARKSAIDLGLIEQPDGPRGLYHAGADTEPSI